MRYYIILHYLIYCIVYYVMLQDVLEIARRLVMGAADPLANHSGQLNNQSVLKGLIIFLSKTKIENQ